MSKANNLKLRLALYIMGLFIITLGVSLSVKSDLGVSPVSSIPYTITCVWGLEMGKATILFHAALVLLQLLILRRSFAPKNLLQVAAGILFGYFTTFSNSLFSLLPTPESLTVRLLMMLISTVLIAIGIFFYLPANIMPLAGEGAIKAISDVSGVPFARVKIAFDISMVTISLVICLIALRSLGSVGIGTVAAAVLVGLFLGQITRVFGKKRDILLGATQAA